MAASSEVPPPSPPSAPERGASGRRKMWVLVLVAVVIVAALAGTVFYILSTQPPPSPAGPTLASVQATATPRSTLNQTETVTVSAKAVDTDGKDQSANATWSWSATPSGAVQLTQILSNRVSARGIATGAVTVTAQATLGSSQKSGTASLTIDAIQLNLAAQGTLAAVGEDFSVTVSVIKPPSRAVYTGYDGVVHFTSTDAAAILPPDSPVFQGVRIVTVRFGTSGIQTFTATDTFAATVTGSVQVRGDRRPVAGFTNQSSPNDRRVATFSSTSTDPDGDPLTRYDWEFGDGSTQSVTTVIVSHTYTGTGTFAVNLTAFDTWGLPSPKKSIGYFVSAPPVASFFSNGTAAVGLNIRVYVDGTGSTGSIQSYNWTWDDGSRTQVTSTKTFHDYGPAYTNKDVNITLNVTDSYGVWDNFTLKVKVTILPLPPVASFEITNSNNITLQVWVDGHNSSDPNSNIATFSWDWGDGRPPTVKNYDPADLATQTATWQYSQEGTYTITLTVTDKTSLSNSQNKAIPLFRPQLPPVAAFSVVKSGYTVDVNASATTDPNGPADIATYNWTWGDGKQNEYTIPTASHMYPSTPMLYTITLKVTDKEGKVGTATRKVSIAATTLDYTMRDFFQVPYGDWWDFRGDKYGDLPIGVTCFNKTAALVYDTCAAEALNPVPISQRTYYTAPPYTNWYPLPGSIRPGHTGNNPLIYAPYRMKVVAANVGAYNVSEPVFLPVLNYAGGLDPTSYVNFDWKFNYATKPDKDALKLNCAGVLGFNDGFDSISTVTLTMDIKSAGRLFGAPTSSVPAASTWWQTNADRDCTRTSTMDARMDSWFLSEGGSRQGLGKYDIANAYEWYFIDWMLQVNGTVDSDGTTHVSIWQFSYGTEALLARWFYWGNTSYIAHWDDSTKARGWWGMEEGWWEDFDFSGTVAATGMDFGLTTVVQYHFQHESIPEPGGTLDKVNDIPTWMWRPILIDYTNDYFPQHLISEQDRYPTQTYLHSTPGSPYYGQQYKYDNSPISWSPKAGEEWHFIFPKTAVRFYDPRTAAGADPTKPFTADPTVKQYMKVDSPLVYQSERPANFGQWDSGNMTWDVYGPLPAPPNDGSLGNYALDETTPGVTANRIVQPKIVFRNATRSVAAASPVTISALSVVTYTSDSAGSMRLSSFVTREMQATFSPIYVRRDSR